MQCWHACPQCKRDYFHEIANPSAVLDDFRKLCERCEAQKKKKESSDDSGLFRSRGVDRRQSDAPEAPYNFFGTREIVLSYQMACKEIDDESAVQILYSGDY